MRSSRKSGFGQMAKQWSAFLLTVKSTREPVRQIADQLPRERKIPFIATDHEIGYASNISWSLRAKEVQEQIMTNKHCTSLIIEVILIGTNDCKPFQTIQSQAPLSLQPAQHPRGIAPPRKIAV
jgi:hypothetical protein